MKTRLLLAILAVLALNAHAFPILYGYDAAGRLRVVNYGGSSNTEFSYDGDGNLLARVSTTNQFIPLAGIYNGLITGYTPTFSNTGTISIMVTSGGLFTGTITLDGVKYAIRGQFDPNTGEPITPIKIRGNTITVSLVLGNGQITGGLSDGESAVISAALSPFNKKSNSPPGGLVGAYTAFFQPAISGTTVPQGYGFGTITVGADGSVKLVGALADGTKISQGSALDETATWPLFIGLYKNGGFIGGDVSLFDDPGVSDFSGALTWIKPVTAGPVYSGTFNTTVNIVGSKYTPPLKNQRVLSFANASPNAVFSGTGGNLTTVLPLIDVTLDMSNKVTGPVGDANKLKLTITTANGLFSGSFFDGTTHTFNGVIFQKQNLGLGFFLGTKESGPVELQSGP